MTAPRDWRRRIEAIEDQAIVVAGSWLRSRVTQLWGLMRNGLNEPSANAGPDALLKLRSGVALAFGLLVFGFLFHWRWAPSAAAVVLGLNALWPQAARILARAWLALAHVLGRVNGFILLSLLYGLVLLPLAGVRRLIRWRQTGSASDPRFPPTAPRQTTFVALNHRYTKADLLKPW